MSWLRRARYEMAGAYRSLRYDLARRSGPRHETTDVLYPEYDAYEPDDRRRRAVTATGIGLVLSGAVAGVYFLVAGGMGVLLAYGSTGTPADRPSTSASPSAPASPSSVPVPAAPALPASDGVSPSPSPSHRPSGHTAPTHRPTRAAASPTPPATAPPSSPPNDPPSPTPQPSVTGTGAQDRPAALAEQP